MYEYLRKFKQMFRNTSLKVFDVESPVNRYTRTLDVYIFTLHNMFRLLVTLQLYAKKSWKHPSLMKPEVSLESLMF